MKTDKKTWIDPKSQEAAILRDMLLHELESRVNAAGKKKKVAKKKEDLTAAPSEHSLTSLRKPPTSSATTSKEYRRMQMKLSSSGESQESQPSVPRERSPKTRSSRSAPTTQDIQFQPSPNKTATPGKRRSTKKPLALDIHFQSQPKDDTPRPNPDARSIFSSRSKMSQSESEESYRLQDDDGTVLQFDPTQEDHVAKRHIGPDGSGLHNTGLGESISSKMATGVEPETPSVRRQQSRRIQSRQLPNQGENVSIKMQQEHEKLQKQEQQKLQQSLGESLHGRSTKEPTKDITVAAPVPACPLPIEADAAAGVAHPEPPSDPAGFTSPAMTCVSKGSSKKSRGFFVRRRSNETDGGDENNTVCSIRSEANAAIGASTTTSSRRLGGTSNSGSGSTRRGTSLGMLRRRSASSDADNDDRSMVSNNTETSGFRNRYSRRTSRRTTKHDHKRLLDDDSDSDY
jgi:hypothetical protein